MATNIMQFLVLICKPLVRLFPAAEIKKKIMMITRIEKLKKIFKKCVLFFQGALLLSQRV